MARAFDGVTDWATIPIDLSGSSVITVSFWHTFPTDYNDTAHTCIEYSNPTWTNGGFIFVPWWNGGTFHGIIAGFAKAGGAGVWYDHFPFQSSNTWWHNLLIFDRVTPKVSYYRTGSLSTGAAVTHNAAPYGNFANSSLNIGRRSDGTLPGAVRFAELAIWDGDVRGALNAIGTGNQSVSLAQSLTSGTPAPLATNIKPLIYEPWLGIDSPEPDYSRNKISATLTGTTSYRHPPTRTTLQPSSA
jgi:hypothetical protein